MSPFQTKPYMVDGHERRALAEAGLQVSTKATAAQSGGGFNLFEMRCPAAFATSLHIHYAEDIALYVLRGTLTVFLGEHSQELAAGSYVFTPRGTAHGFRVTSVAGARILCLSLPAGLDSFLNERGLWAEAANGELIAAKYKIEILGPLPE